MALNGFAYLAWTSIYSVNFLRTEPQLYLYQAVRLTPGVLPVSHSTTLLLPQNVLLKPTAAYVFQLTPVLMKLRPASASVLDQVFPSDDAIVQVLNNPVLQLNFIAAREVKVRKSERKAAQLRRLMLAAGANLLQPALLQKFYKRVVMQNHSTPTLLQRAPHEAYPLTLDNFKASLLASGSIPMVMHPVKEIRQAYLQVYHMDGGLLDYHLPLPYQQEGLILYPHFYPYLIPALVSINPCPGVMPKHDADGQNDPVCPSSSWVKSLPYGKIQDRKDFDKLTDTQRLKVLGLSAGTIKRVGGGFKIR